MSLSAKQLAEIQARLAAKGLRRKNDGGPRPQAPISPRAISFGQERLWFLEQLLDASPVFNIPALYRIQGPLDSERLSQALRAEIMRQESLRCAFVSRDGRPEIQLIDDDFELPLQVIEQSSPCSQSATLALAREEARRPFDLERAPLVRLTLYVLAQDEHLLLINMHHIISEVQSLGIFASELAATYAALARGLEPELPALPVRFSDFAAWQRERMQGERYGEQLAWWRERLDASLPNLQLPSDRKPPALQSFAGGTATRALPKQLVRELREYARTRKATVFSVTLALWSALLARYSGQKDILIGVPVTDRNRAELRDLIGLFVNTLVMRTDHSSDPSFDALVAEVDEYQRGAQSNQEIPFDRLVEELGVIRELSHGPLFQVAFLYQTQAESGGALHQLDESTEMRPLADPLAVHTGTSKFWASLVIWDEAEDISVSLEYNTDLFDAASIERMLGHFEVLLSGALSAPGQPLSSLPMLSEGEAEQILGSWSQNQRELPQLPVHQLFEACVRATPAALALGSGDVQWSYAELNARANRLAHYLFGLGVQKADVLAIAAGRTPEMVVAMLASLKLGAAYLPLDLEYPAERLAYQIEHAEVRAVLTLSQLESRLPLERLASMPGKPSCIAIDTDWPLIEACSERELELPVASTSNDLAYVIYTSGSTGKPKGVAIEHGALCNLLSWHQRAFSVTPRDRASHLAGLAFDAAVWELWPYLCAGASVHLVPDDVRLDPAGLLRWVEQREITQGFWPTPLCEAILQLELPETMSLDVVFTGGDKLRRAPGKRLPFRLNNNYGPTENAVVSTSGDVRLDAPRDLAPTIGKPIDNVAAYVLNPAMQPQPIGVPGELYVGGASLARGYFKSPELTAERFVPNPFQAGERLYKTGDLVRWRADGEIEFLGRMDAQVKLRGFRIELGEIESALSSQPSVASCAVSIQRDAEGDGTLVGYVVFRAGQAEEPEALRGHLARSLPEYMLPAQFVFLERMPLTPNGKLDRKALMPLDLEALAEASFVAPEGEYEQRIAAVWCRVLGRESVGVSTNFFDLGGHSLLLAQVHSELIRTIDKPLGIIELFRFPTVRSLAEHLSDGESGTQEIEASRARGAKRREAASRSRSRRQK